MPPWAEEYGVVELGVTTIDVRGSESQRPLLQHRVGHD